MNESTKRDRSLVKTILKQYPASFANALSVVAVMVVNSIIAGLFLGADYIAAIAIATPILGLVMALISIFLDGTDIVLSISVGRGKRDESNRLYSLGIVSSVAAAFMMIALILLFANQLVLPFGGSADAVAAERAAFYLRFKILSYPLTAMMASRNRALQLYGLVNYVFAAFVIATVLDIGGSIILMKLLPEEWKLASMGISGIISQGVSIFIVYGKKIPLSFRLCRFKLGEVLHTAKHGLHSTANSIIDSFIGGFINNIILNFFKGDGIMALSVYSVVKSVSQFAQASVLGVIRVFDPLMGLLFGAKDKGGMRSVIKSGFILGLCAILIWGGIIALFTPQLAGIFGISGNPNVQIGVLVLLCFLPAFLVVQLLTSYHEIIGKIWHSLMYAVVPDSIIYPLLLVMLLPVWGYMGIWISLGINGLVFVLLVYAVRVIMEHRPVSFNKFLYFDKAKEASVLDISVNVDTRVAGALSEQVDKFMLEKGASRRTAYMTALSIEELTADFVAHTGEISDKSEIADIKVISDEDCYRVIMRNAAKPYNPLDFELDDESFAKVGVKMVQRVARKIEYSFLFQMNVVTIEMEK